MFLKKLDARLGRRGRSGGGGREFLMNMELVTHIPNKKEYFRLNKTGRLLLDTSNVSN